MQYPPEKGIANLWGEMMGSKLKLGRCRFNGGVEQEPGQHRHVLRRCLASVVAVSLSIVCMVPAAYAQNIDDVSSSPNAVISEGGGGLS